MTRIMNVKCFYRTLLQCISAGSSTEYVKRKKARLCILVVRGHQNDKYHIILESSSTLKITLAGQKRILVQIRKV
jgi:hypothetical protein